MDAVRDFDSSVFNFSRSQKQFGPDVEKIADLNVFNLMFFNQDPDKMLFLYTWNGNNQLKQLRSFE